MSGGSAEEGPLSDDRSRSQDGDLTPAPPPALLFECPQCRSRSPLPDQAGAAEIACPCCGSRVDLVDDAALDDTPEGDALPGQTLGRFQLLKRLGAGGFGVVWKARDPQLDRVVAVKVPHRGRLGRDESQKVLREARAAAQLRHPNIVSVHEVGLDSQRLYIVSDFVEGQTLDAWLADRRLSARESAAMGAKIADALDHAHRLGVIHRDLKPGNIMVDCQGEPHIMDFGLAKRATGEMTMTIEGQVLGTPAYMSPEQAKGHGHAADARTDVYSLGVILFEMLTRERPFRGNVQMLLKQVIEDEPPSPRKFDSRVPRDLETICLKCLQKPPDHRYGSARAVGDELRRFLAGEPIAARPVGAMERSVRWCRRKPLVAGLTAAAVLGLVFGMAAATIGYVRVSLALKDTRVAQAQERQAVNDLFTRVSEDRLLREPGMQQLRKDLLELARSYYEKLLERSTGDEDLHEVGLAHYRVGRITEEIGTSATALESYRQAEALQRQLLDAAPDDVDRLEALGNTLNAMGCALAKVRQLDAAETPYAEAIEVRKRLVALAPDNAKFQGMLANTHMNVGLTERWRDPARARESMELAQAIRREALATCDGDPKLGPKIRHDLATGCFELARLLEKTDPAFAQRNAEESRMLFDKLVEEDAAGNRRPDLALQYRLAWCYRLEGDLVCNRIFGAKQHRTKPSDQERKQVAQAAAAFRAALNISEPLAAKNPDVDEYQAMRAEIYLYLGQLEEAQGHREAAVAALGQAEAALRRLVSDHPEDPRYLDPFIRAVADLGALRTGDPAQRKAAARTLEELKPRIERMAAGEPPTPGAARLLLLLKDAMTQVGKTAAAKPRKDSK